MIAAHDIAVVLAVGPGVPFAASLRSIYGQSASGRIQVLLGLEQAEAAPELDALLAQAPSHVRVGVLDPGRPGAPLRTMLAYLAHAPRVAFLDGGNLWRADHLERLLGVQEGRPWAFGRRAFVHAANGTVLAADDWESVGPPGPVAADCLLLAVTSCEPVFRHWAEPGGDAAVGRALAAIPGWGVSTETTVLVPLDPAAPGDRARWTEVVRRKARGFAGHRQFDEGAFAAAAASFDALFALDRPSAEGLAWRYLARARSGARAEARAELEAILDPTDAGHRAVRDVMLSAGLPRRLHERLRPGQPSTAETARMAFFAAQAALLAGDDISARDLLAHAAAGPQGTREVRSARVEQARQGWIS